MATRLVAAEDAVGNVVSSFNGTLTVALGNNPTGATLGGTLTATINSGAATFSGLTLDKVGTGYTLRATGGGLTAATTNAFNVTTTAATKRDAQDILRKRIGDRQAGKLIGRPDRVVLAEYRKDGEGKEQLVGGLR